MRKLKLRGYRPRIQANSVSTLNLVWGLLVYATKPYLTSDPDQFFKRIKQLKKDKKFESLLSKIKLNGRESKKEIQEIIEFQQKKGLLGGPYTPVELSTMVEEQYKKTALQETNPAYLIELRAVKIFGNMVIEEFRQTYDAQTLGRLEQMASEFYRIL